MNNVVPFAVILAGGKGSRLWPISRSASPKHVIPLPLEGGRTMLQNTVLRLAQWLPLDHLYISTTSQQYREVRRQLPMLAREQYCIEQGRKGTGVGIALAALSIRRRDQNAVIVSVNSDAAIGNEQRYRAAIRKAAQVAWQQQRHIILVGVPPAYPESALGYIVVGGRPLARYRGLARVFAVRRFVEKPTVKRAARLLEDSTAFWNPTLVVARISTLWSAYQANCPHQAAILESIIPASGPLPTLAGQRQLFGKLQPISIEYDLLEHCRNLLMVDAGDIGWSDIGQWRTVMEILSRRRRAGTVSIGRHLDEHSDHLMVYNTTPALVATVKLSNIILIVTRDVILAVDQRYAQDVKSIVERLEQRGWKQFL